MSPEIFAVVYRIFSTNPIISRGAGAAVDYFKIVSLQERVPVLARKILAWLVHLKEV